MFLIIAVIQTVPLFLVAYISRKLSALNVAMVVMLILAVAVGAGAFFVVDAVMLIVAYLICLQLIAPRESRRSNSNQSPPQEKSILDKYPQLDEDARVALAAIEFTGKNILKNKKVSQLDAEYMAICQLLDGISEDGHGKKGTQIITNVVEKAYPQHARDMMTYLDWRNGKLALNDDSVRFLLARLRRVPPVGRA